MGAEAGRGFTLLEVMVGLTLGAMVVLFVHQTFGATVALDAGLDSLRVAHGREMRARESLTRLFGSLAIGQRGAGGFDGDPDRVAFSTSDENGTRQVDLLARDGRLVVRSDAWTDTLLAADSVAFDYLMALGSGSAWVAQWHSPLSAPVAVRLRLRRSAVTTDTLFLAIGPRG